MSQRLVNDPDTYSDYAKPKQLCRYCSNIPWSSLRSWRQSAEGDMRFAVDFRQVLPRNCTICKAFYDMKGAWGKEYLTFSEAGPDSLFTGLLEFTTFEGWPVRQLESCTGVMYNEKSAIRLSPEFVDFSYWTEKIGMNESLDKNNTQDFWVIDCASRAVVMASEGCTYLALSYVWGPAASTEVDYTFPGLPEVLPRTIEDAITVTKRLGYQFLWVDRYCIDQKNDQAKHQQIQQMRNVYASATITIIAAAGDSPDYGLPGVSLPRSYASPPVQQVESAVLVPTSVEVMRDFERSVWVSRAWTFQENFVSQRRLLFGDRVTFYADRLEWTSDLAPGFSSSTNLESFLPSCLVTVRAYNRYTWARTCMEAYCARSLTYDADALNAVLGILDHFSKDPRRPMQHIWGVLVAPVDVDGPFASRFPECLEVSIHWYHEKPCRRRSGFPSWSPLAWEGHLKYRGQTDCPNTVPMIPSKYGLEIMGADGKHHELVAYLRGGQMQRDSGQDNAPNILRFLHVLTVPFRLEQGDDGLEAVVQIDQSDEVLLPVFWDCMTVDYTSVDLMGIAITTYQHGDISLLVVKPNGLHHERVGMILWGYRTGRLQVRNRKTGARRYIRAFKDKGKLAGPPHFALERRQDITLV